MEAFLADCWAASRASCCNSYGGLRLPILPMLLVGIICGGVGQIGDLFASVIKRWAGAKDYGNIFPGHGGVIDRLDSVLMCAPVVLCYVWLSMLG